MAERAHRFIIALSVHTLCTVCCGKQGNDSGTHAHAFMDVNIVRIPDITNLYVDFLNYIITFLIDIGSY